MGRFYKISIIVIGGIAVLLVLLNLLALYFVETEDDTASARADLMSIYNKLSYDCVETLNDYYYDPALWTINGATVEITDIYTDNPDLMHKIAYTSPDKSGWFKTFHYNLADVMVNNEFIDKDINFTYITDLRYIVVQGEDTYFSLGLYAVNTDGGEMFYYDGEMVYERKPKFKFWVLW
jgi:hypothetical protein